MENEDYCCSVCQNQYEKSELTFVQLNMVCVYCAEEWFKSNKEFKDFSEWAVKFKVFLDKDYKGEKEGVQ